MLHTLPLEVPTPVEAGDVVEHTDLPWISDALRAIPADEMDAFRAGINSDNAAVHRRVVLDLIDVFVAHPNLHWSYQQVGFFFFFGLC